jgi:hypothetical protein
MALWLRPLRLGRSARKQRSDPAMATPGGAYETAVLADTPWAYWSLDDGAGPAASDSSGNGRPAVYNNAVLQQPPAASFGGFSVLVQNNDTVIRAPGPAPAATPLTIEAWIAFIASPNAFSTLIGQGDAGAVPGYFLLTSSSAPAGQYSIHNPGVALFTTGVPLLTGWHLFHLVRTTPAGVAGRLQLFIDGINVFDVAGVINVGPSNININGQGASNFDSALYDEVAVYTAVLPQARMLAHLEAAGVVQGAPLGSATGVQVQTALAAVTADLSEILAFIRQTYQNTP